MQVLIAQPAHLSDLVALHHTLFSALHPEATSDVCQTQSAKRAHEEISSGISLLAYGSPDSFPPHVDIAEVILGGKDKASEQAINIAPSSSIQSMPHSHMAMTQNTVNSAEATSTGTDSTPSFLQDKVLSLPEVNDAFEHGSTICAQAKCAEEESVPPQEMQLLGRCMLYQTFSDVVHISRLYVLPPFRHHGVATALVLSAMSVACKAGYSMLCLDTISTLKPACDLYRKLKFTEFTAEEAFAQNLWPHHKVNDSGLLFMQELQTTLEHRLPRCMQALDTSIEALPPKEQLRKALQRYPS